MRLSTRMKVAILGSTGHVGRSLAAELLRHPDIRLVLYSRRGDLPGAGEAAIDRARVELRSTTALDFGGCDIVVNAIGVGTPDKIAAAGASVMQLTLEWEERIKAALAAAPDCLYVFASSGAIYGTLRDGPASLNSVREFSVNAERPANAYGKAKFVAEALHRSWTHKRILDVRIFGYVSECIDLQSTYLLSQIFASLLQNRCFVTNLDDVVRDYVGPKELSHLILGAAKAHRINDAVDLFSLAPVRKFEILDELKKFGLRCSFVEGENGSAANVGRLNYYSTYSRACDYGYAPQRTALDVVLDSAQKILNAAQGSFQGAVTLRSSDRD